MTGNDAGQSQGNVAAGDDQGAAGVGVELLGGDEERRVAGRLVGQVEHHRIKREERDADRVGFSAPFDIVVGVGFAEEWACFCRQAGDRRLVRCQARDRNRARVLIGKVFEILAQGIVLRPGIQQREGRCRFCLVLAVLAGCHGNREIHGIRRCRAVAGPAAVGIRKGRRFIGRLRRHPRDQARSRTRCRHRDGGELADNLR